MTGGLGRGHIGTLQSDTGDDITHKQRLEWDISSSLSDVQAGCLRRIGL